MNAAALDVRSGAPLPPEARLAMPAQDLRSASARRPARANPPRVLVARLIAFGGAAALTVMAASQMLRVFDPETINLLQWALLVLFVATFGWIAFSATSALAGVLAAPSRPLAAEDGPLTTRTAIVMPVYNENAAASFGALAALGQGLADRGVAEAFEIFVLSDTRDPDAWARETTAFAALRRLLPAGLNAWYRRRQKNAGRKAGNVQDFVERWGGRYDFMLVLDADSLMDAATVEAMARRMAADPRLGLLQTTPTLVGADTPYGVLQQFATALYGPIVARGVAAWQGEDGNFWGHNALIRVRAFAESAGLPELPGRKPFGGHVLSHDFVEAALLRRAGWAVRMDPDLGGSWEGPPPSLLAAAARDRRWAQGNLQHLAIIGAKGLRWPSRAHFAIGVGSYLASPLWLAMLTVGLALSVQASFYRPEYFPDAFQLFPSWPRFDAERMLAIFAATMTLLFLPRILGLAEATGGLLRRGRPLAAIRTLLGAVAETALSALTAPIMMMMQSRHVVEILAGRDSGWSTQERAGAVLPWSAAFAAHGRHAAIGVVGAVGAWLAQPELLAWMAPVLAGLVLAPLLSRASGDPALGARMARLGLFAAPDDPAAPAVLATADAAEAAIAAAAAPGVAGLINSDSARAHAAALEGPGPAVTVEQRLARVTACAKIVSAETPHEALGWFSPEETVAMVSDPELLALWRSRGAVAPV